MYLSPPLNNPVKAADEVESRVSSATTRRATEETGGDVASLRPTTADCVRITMV